MYCSELDRLLELHSVLTMEYFRQDARTQEFYSSYDEYAAECQRLAEVEQQLTRAAAAVVHHRRQHACGGPADPWVCADLAVEDTKEHVAGHD